LKLGKRHWVINLHLDKTSSKIEVFFALKNLDIQAQLSYMQFGGHDKLMILFY